jgi:hypothetical protein
LFDFGFAICDLALLRAKEAKAVGFEQEKTEGTENFSILDLRFAICDWLTEGWTTIRLPESAVSAES